MPEKKWCEQWKPVFTMVGIDVALAIVNVLLKKVLVEGMNRLVLVSYRQSIATIFLAPIAYFWERESRPKLTAPTLCRLFFSAMVGATITQNLFLYGIEFTSATFACAFINMVPAITFLLALPFKLESVNLKSKSGRAKALGTVVCVGGAMVLTLYKGTPLTNPNPSLNFVHTTNRLVRQEPSSSSLPSTSSSSSSTLNKRGERWTLGSLALVAGSICWSSWFLVQAKIGQQYPCQYSSTAIMLFFSALQSALLALLIDRDISMWILRGRTQILTVLYAGMMASGLCFVGMAWCVKQRGPLFTAAFSPLIQIIVALFDFTILNEPLHVGSILGSILVILGLYILLWGKSKEATDVVTNPRVEVVEEQEQGDEATTHV